MIIALRIAFAAVAVVAVWLAISTMVRLSWGVDVVIAAIACIAFSYYFERDIPPNDLA